jgi:hypothetical protein
MNFLTKSELAAYPSSVLGKLSDYGEIAITDDGKPTALLLQIPDGLFNETLKAVRQVKAMKSLNDIWAKTKNLPSMTDEEIEAEIQAVRAEAKTAY